MTTCKAVHGGMAVPMCLLSQGLQVSEPMWAFSNKTMLAEGLEGCMSFSTFSGCGSLPSTVTSPPEKESVSWLHPQGSLSLRLQGQPSESSFFFLTMTNPIWNVYKIRQNMAGSAPALGLWNPFTAVPFGGIAVSRLGFL